MCQVGATHYLLYLLFIRWRIYAHTINEFQKRPILVQPTRRVSRDRTSANYLGSGGILFVRHLSHSNRTLALYVAHFLHTQKPSGG